ncbi:hypothetical protein GW17_00015465 [Ensete ventricosum]|nr:hypothetical protein GW17_00015465 [Ensete ventricosum]
MGVVGWSAHRIRLPCRQPLAGKGVAGWSAHRVCSVMLPIACCRGCHRRVSPSHLLYHVVNRAVTLSVAHCQERCGSIGTPDLPVVLTEAGLASDVCPTW